MTTNSLTSEQAAEAHALIVQAQAQLLDAARLLRASHDITKNERIFDVIWTLESRAGRRSDCFAPTYNLDDVLASLPTEAEAA